MRRSLTVVVTLGAFLCHSHSFQTPLIVKRTEPARARRSSIENAPTAQNEPHDTSNSCVERHIQKGNRNDAATRGTQYGATNNSTIPTANEAATLVGVRPPADVAARVWKRAWTLQKYALPLLHAFDRVSPPDSKLSLACLWWKALSGNDVSSPVWDQGLAYDLLPRGSRVLVGPRLRRFYPRLHHANVEIRTAFLDASVSDICRQVVQTKNDTQVRLVSLGAGYDVRSMKLRRRGLIQEAVELDLPQVIDAKQRLLHSRRFEKRQRSIVDDGMLPKLYQVDLNQVDSVRSILKDILAVDDDKDKKIWWNIFLFEGVMIYLDKGVPASLLGTCRQVLESTGQSGSLCFADRLENIPGGDVDIGRQELAKHGWNIVDWKPKPGLARHMGRAEII